MSLFSSLGQGDIWSITGINFESPVNDILDKENFTIEELLQEDELLQEVKSRNGRLIEFLTLEDVMEKLINFIISPANSEDGDLRIYKYPYMSCEVLCCEIPDILHILVEESDGKYLIKLFSVLDFEETLNHHLAGYFEKTLEMLFRRMTIPVMTYLNKGGESLLKKFLKHIDNYSIMQIVQRLLLPHIPFSIGTVDLDSIPPEDRQNCQCNWSYLDGTCGFLCEKMLEEGSSDVPSHVSDLLITVLQLSPPDAVFISHLCDATCLTKLFTAAFADNAEVQELSLLPPSPIANVSLAAISVLESLVSRLCETMHPFDAMGAEMQPDQVQQALQQVQRNTDRVCSSLLPCMPRLAQQLELHLLNRPCGHVPSQVGCSFLRLGHRGLQLIKLVESVLRLNNPEIDESLWRNKLVQTCIDLMFRFDLNSLLHLAVQRIVMMIMEGGSSRRELQRVLISDCGLLSRIIDSVTSRNADLQSSRAKLAGCGPPIVGHVILMAQAVTSAVQSEAEGGDHRDGEISDNGDSIRSLIVSSGMYADWERFVNSELQSVMDLQSQNQSSLSADSPRNSPSLPLEGLARIGAGTVGAQVFSVDIDDMDDDDPFSSAVAAEDSSELEADIQSLTMSPSFESSFPPIPGNDKNNGKSRYKDVGDTEEEMAGVTFAGVAEAQSQLDNFSNNFEFAQFDNVNLGAPQVPAPNNFDFNAFFPPAALEATNTGNTESQDFFFETAGPTVIEDFFADFDSQPFHLDQSASSGSQRDGDTSVAGVSEGGIRDDKL